MKVDNFIQVNTQNNFDSSGVKDTLPKAVQEKIADSLINQHESKLRKKYEDEH